MAADLKNQVVVACQFEMYSVLRVNPRAVDRNILNFHQLDLQGGMSQIQADELAGANGLTLQILIERIQALPYSRRNKNRPASAFIVFGMSFEFRHGFDELRPEVSWPRFRS